jgi:hypothetical protein
MTSPDLPSLCSVSLTHGKSYSGYSGTKDGKEGEIMNMPKRATPPKCQTILYMGHGQMLILVSSIQPSVLRLLGIWLSFFFIFIFYLT